MPEISPEMKTFTTKLFLIIVPLPPVLPICISTTAFDGALHLNINANSTNKDNNLKEKICI